MSISLNFYVGTILLYTSEFHQGFLYLITYTVQYVYSICISIRFECHSEHLFSLTSKTSVVSVRILGIRNAYHCMIASLFSNSHRILSHLRVAMRAEAHTEYIQYYLCTQQTHTHTHAKRRQIFLA